MSIQIQPLKPIKSSPPSWWTMFLDATDPPAFSWSRIMGFLLVFVFLILVVYFSLQSGSLIVPSKEWVYILVAFAASKPIQRYAESKDNEAALNYDFQMAQLNMGILNSTTTPPVQPTQVVIPVVTPTPKPVVNEGVPTVQMP